jgi:hypothetical protein
MSYLNVVHRVLVGSHLEDHVELYGQQLLHAEIAAGRAAEVFDEEGFVLEEDFGMGSRDTFLHDHDLVRAVTADFAATGVQFIKGGLWALTGVDHDLVLHGVFKLHGLSLFLLL